MLWYQTQHFHVLDDGQSNTSRAHQNEYRFPHHCFHWAAVAIRVCDLVELSMGSAVLLNRLSRRIQVVASHGWGRRFSKTPPESGPRSLAQAFDWGRGSAAGESPRTIASIYHVSCSTISRLTRERPNHC
jgi:hypothetical protein